MDTRLEKNAMGVAKMCRWKGADVNSSHSSPLICKVKYRNSLVFMAPEVSNNPHADSRIIAKLSIRRIKHAPLLGILTANLK